MKPVLVLQHLDDGGPGFFCEFADQAGVTVQVVRPDLGQPLPEPRDLAKFLAVCICGGTQCANDPDPWIAREIDLIRAAADTSLPVIGHCLGGQMISKALGGEVQRDAVTEFGWQRLLPTVNDLSRSWLGPDTEPLFAMQWHYDICTLPPGATPLLRGEHWHNQAFVAGNILAMQFHVEMTERQIRHWVTDLRDLIPERAPGVQSADEVLEQMPRFLPASRKLAFRLYQTCLNEVLPVPQADAR